jgi:hypothetical protein
MVKVGKLLLVIATLFLPGTQALTQVKVAVITGWSTLPPFSHLRKRLTSL